MNMTKTITISKDELETLVLDKLDIEAPEGCTLVTTLEPGQIVIVIGGLDPE